MKSLKLVFAITTLCVAVSIPVLANAANADHGMAGACKGDVQQFCKGVQPGGGQIAKCLKEHHEDLSPGCKKAAVQMREKMKERMEEVRDQCKDDAQKLCKDTKPGGGRIIQCLKKNQSQLSSGCASAIQPRGKTATAPAASSTGDDSGGE